MPHESGNISSIADPDTQSPTGSAKECWDSLLSLQSNRRALDEIYREAEKLVQHYVTIAVVKELEWLRTRVETSEQEAAAALAAKPVDPARQRRHAALAGALAGLLYPLGRSPRDLNRMAF